MLRKKLLLIAICCLLAAAMLFTACSGSGKGNSDNGNSAKVTSGEGELDKYSPPITLTAMRYLGPQVKYADGESIEKNIWTKAYEEKLGIKLKYTFTSPDFQTFDVKVNMAIASDSLPDIMPMYTTLFFRAADSGRCADLKDAYDKYLMKEVKDLLNMADGVVLKVCTRNGKLNALANPPYGKYKGGDMLWIRDDWLKKLNLQAPKNMDDVISIAKAFTEKDPDGNGEKDTFGLAIDKDLGGMQGFSQGYHAYSGWVEKDGKFVRGDTQPEMKTALTKLNELYMAGAIDEEFVLKSGEDLKMDYGSEYLGMVFGSTAMPDGAINQTIKSNPDAEWGIYEIPSCDDKPALAVQGSGIGDFLAMNVKCQYPEALMRLINLQYVLSHDNSPEDRAYHDKDGIDTFWYPVAGVNDPDYNMQCHEKVVKALETGNVSELNGEQKGYYDRIKTWTDSKNPEGWGMYRIFGPEGSYAKFKEFSEKGNYTINKLWGPETPAWKEHGPNLAYKRLEYFSRFIIGELTMEQFDEWVNYFYNNGGQKAEEEINEWYQANKG